MDMQPVEFNDVRGTDGIKEATYNIAGMDVKVAVCSGLANAKKVLQMIKDGTADTSSSRSWPVPAAASTAAASPLPARSGSQLCRSESAPCQSPL